MLATCLHLQEAYGVSIEALHTFDDGKKRHPIDGKTIPLLSYQEWCEGMEGEHLALANRVISIRRAKPIHPSPRLPIGPISAKASPSQPPPPPVG
jgi:hypothetical protein